MRDETTNISGWLGAGSRSATVHGIMVTVLAIVVYANSLPGIFILDDIPIVRENPLVQKIDLIAIFRSDYWHGSANTGLYRPLTVLSLALNRLLLGISPWGFHLVNVLLHATVTWLLWRFLKRWGFAPRVALFSAALFAVHPLHGEVVNVIVGRSELLAALFMLVGLTAARDEGRAADALVLAAFGLALLSKEHAVVFIPLALLWEWFFYRTTRVRRLARRYGGLLLIALFWLSWRALGIDNPLPPAVPSPETTPLVFAPLTTRLLTGLALQGLYLYKLFFAAGLQLFYSRTELPDLIAPDFSLKFLLILASALLLIFLLITGWRRRSSVALFALAYCISFAVTANILLPIGVTFAERLAYFPSVWFSCAFAASTAMIGARVGRVIWWGAVFYLLALGIRGVSRNHAFTDEVRLYRAEVENNPADVAGWVNLAEGLAIAGEMAAAEGAYQNARRLAPENSYVARSHALFLAVEGRGAEGRLATMRAMELGQKQTDPVQKARDCEALALAWLELAAPEMALTLLDQSATILRDPGRRPDLRGRALTALGRDAEAIAVFERGNVPLTESDALYSYGLSLFRLGRPEAALAQLRQAPADMVSADFWNLLGAVYAKLGDWRGAADAIERAVALDPGNEHYRSNLRQARSKGSAAAR